jgi:5'-nucleotidase
MKNHTLLAMTLGAALLGGSGPAVALNIALTNDDGWDAHGVQALAAALIDAGHTVTLVGSTQNQSGTSAAIDLVGYGSLVVTKEADDGDNDQFSVNDTGAGDGAYPATAGQIAINIASQQGDVDLLISGTNAGANIGAFTTLSGTVGAALHGISYVSGERVPSIAISTDEPQPLRNCGVDEGNPTGAEAAACDEANIAQFEIVAAWMVEFVAKLESKPGLLHKGGGLLPPGVALNINHPIGTILGSKLTRQGRLPSLGGYPIGLPIGVFGDSNGMAVGETTFAGITGQPFISARERHNADTTAYNSGYVSIVPIENDLTASGFTFLRVRHLAHDHTH